MSYNKTPLLRTRMRDGGRRIGFFVIRLKLVYLLKKSRVVFKVFKNQQKSTVTFELE